MENSMKFHQFFSKFRWKNPLVFQSVFENIWGSVPEGPKKPPTPGNPLGKLPILSIKFSIPQ
jgi:hypothetical protein